MVKARFDAKLCVRGLSSKQQECLRNDVYQHLLDQFGTPGAVHSLSAATINSEAFAFLDSDQGKSYWPLSDDGAQTTFPASSDEMELFIADLMRQGRNKYVEENPECLIDHDPKKSTPKRSPDKSRKTPKKTVMEQLQQTSSGRKTVAPLVLNSGRRQLRDTTSSFSQDSYQPPAPDRSKSPTVALDIPYEAPSMQAPRTPRKSIVPTEASRRIALDQALDETISIADGTDEDTVALVQPSIEPLNNKGKEPIRNTHPLEGVPSSSKRPYQSTTPDEKPTKRVAMEPPATHKDRNSDELMSSEPVTEAVVAATTDPIRGTPVTPTPAQPVATTVPQDNKEAQVDTLIRSCGHDFTPAALARVPFTILTYIKHVKKANLRAAKMSDTEEKRSQFQYRARIFHDLHSDIESRIESEAIPSDEEGEVRVETTFSLDASKTRGRMNLDHEHRSNATN